jgi:Predicted transcriptional regulators
LVQLIEIEKLNPAPYNPRVELQPGMKEWEKLKKSIIQFGNVEPVVWNQRTGNVVGGHQRLAVLQSMGETLIPCSVVDMDEKDEKLLNIALNKIKGRWDYDKLADILRDYDTELATITGFAEDEIAIILANNEDFDESDIDYSDWEEDEEELLIGGSFVITLVFKNAELAEEWAEREGYKKQIRENSSTTVIRMGDENEQTE